MLEFAKALPVIRATVAEHMALRGLTRRKVLATVVHLLETTLIRVGNDEYAKANQSFGLTTLRADHVEVEGTEVRFRFTGKSGKQWSLAMRDRRVAKILRACQELPGQDLLHYLDDDKELRGVSSDDVNDYLREIAGYDVTAKNFRTWAGTVMMARRLHEAGEAESERAAKTALRAALKSRRRRARQHAGGLPQVLYPPRRHGRLARAVVPARDCRRRVRGVAAGRGGAACDVERARGDARAGKAEAKGSEERPRD